jgi:hypothetical protein
VWDFSYDWGKLRLRVKRGPGTMLGIQAAFCCEHRSDHTVQRRQIALDRSWGKMGPVDLFETQEASKHPG